MKHKSDDIWSDSSTGNINDEMWADYQEGDNYETLAERYKLPSYEAARSRIRRYRERLKGQGEDPESVSIEDLELEHDFDEPSEDEPETIFQVKGNIAMAASSDGLIRTLEQLVKACEVDLRVWRVRDFLTNAWSMGRKKKYVDIRWEDGKAHGFVKDTGQWEPLQNYQIKAWFVPRQEYPFEEALKEILSQAEKLGPTKPVRSIPPVGKHLLAPALFDAHFNKMSADGTYSLANAAEVYKRTARAVLERTIGMRHTVDRVLLVVGQDALHTDNLFSTTTKGTWVQTAALQAEAIKVLFQTITSVIEMYRNNLAPVDVIVVPGNHDAYSSLWLEQCLKAYFRQTPDVGILDWDVDNTRRYYLYGKTLIGMDHGDTGKPDDLALTMAVEAPQKWAASTYREFLRGHLHKRGTLFHPVVEEKGVIVRMLPALCPSDKWHMWRAFVGSHRAAEAMLYHKEHGPAGSFPIFVNEVMGS